MSRLSTKLCNGFVNNGNVSIVDLSLAAPTDRASVGDSQGLCWRDGLGIAERLLMQSAFFVPQIDD